MKDKLKACPFCGLHVELVSAKTYPNGERSPAYIKCKRCNYHIAGYEDKDVINQWNTRPIEDALNARVAELEEENDRLQDGWFRDETICPDGSLRPKVSDLLNRIAELSQAVGLITTLKPTMVMDTEHPLDMAKEVAEYVNARIAKLEEAQRWIPVGERLPEEKQNVLALDRTGTAYHWEYSRSLSNIFVSDYTHWMPLPEVPNV